MDVSLLIPIAIYCDIETTDAMACVCSIFTDINIWKLKFNLEFQHCQYVETWSSKTNYVVQKKNNFSILIHKENVLVDNVLYEHAPVYDHFNKVLDNHTKQKFGPSIMQFVKIPTKTRYLILYENEHILWGDTILCCTQKEEATKMAEALHNLAISRQEYYFDLVLIDLAKMHPYFIWQRTVPCNIEQCYELFTND
jgi:hypothetical protein